MKTITKDNVSLYLFNDDQVLNIGDTIEALGKFVIGDLNSSNSVLVEGVTEPDGWVGGKYLYTTDWELNPDYVAPEPEPITQAQKDAQFLNEVSQIKQGYTEDEIKSWAKQEAEARGWTADNTYPTPLLDGIISQTQESKSTLAATIITKADLYAAAFGAALGRKRA